jgi:hypothetical protein
MRLVAMLPCSLGMLLGVRRVLFALRVVAFAMMFGGGAMRFGGILVMFRCLIVFVFGHRFLRFLWGEQGDKLPVPLWFLETFADLGNRRSKPLL